jgi:hypothetical protein
VFEIKQQVLKFELSWILTGTGAINDKILLENGPKFQDQGMYYLLFTGIERTIYNLQTLYNDK